MLTSVVDDDEDATIYALDRPEFWRSQVSGTFHGRDVFAPVAAHLARGARPDTLGTLRSGMVRLPWPRPWQCGDEIRGEVIHIDRFGNLITNLRLEDLGSDPQRACFRVRDTMIAGITPHYAAGDGIMVLVNSSGRIEVALPGASAARTLQIGIGAEIRVSQT